jgi:hypothetical protein
MMRAGLVVMTADWLDAWPFLNGRARELRMTRRKAPDAAWPRRRGRSPQLSSNASSRRLGADGPGDLPLGPHARLARGPAEPRATDIALPMGWGGPCARWG